ncbi:MAG: winged helix-turn-helix domain-containing protein [Candidatus Woesearchaeota archaeon]
MAEKRERMDVVYDILNAVIKHNNKIGPTRLIQLSNLSPAMFREYTNELVKQQILNEHTDKTKKFYSITNKGYSFIEKYKTFKKFIDELGI